MNATWIMIAASFGVSAFCLFAFVIWRYVRLNKQAKCNHD